MRVSFALKLLGSAAALIGQPIAAAATVEPNTANEKGREIACVVYSEDGVCVVNSREAKGNDFNWLVTREDLVEFCRYRAITRPDRKWCELIGL